MPPRLLTCYRMTRFVVRLHRDLGSSRIVGEDSHVTLLQRAPAKWPWVWGLGRASGSIVSFVGLQLIPWTWPWLDWIWGIFCSAIGLPSGAPERPERPGRRSDPILGMNKSHRPLTAVLKRGCFSPRWRTHFHSSSQPAKQQPASPGKASKTFQLNNNKHSPQKPTHQQDDGRR